MAREKMVTRTVATTEATIMVCNITTVSVEVKTVTIAGEHTAESALTYLQKHDTADTKTVAVQSVKTIENLYGMTENDFLKYAKLLPPRTAQQSTED